MSVSKGEADEERASAEADIREDGARCTLYFDGRLVDSHTGAKSGASTLARSVKIFALLGSYSAKLVDGQRVQQGDLRVTLADKSLVGMSLAPLTSVLDERASTGFWLYLPRDPGKFPEATDPPASGDRRLAVVALENTVYVGGYAVLRVLQCRG